MTDIPVLIDGPQTAAATLILAHGAGAPMDSAFMSNVASGIAEAGIRVVRFEFPYMRRAREEGTKRPPDRGPVLEAAWLDMIARFGPAESLVIGGKSLGGRIASMIAPTSGVKGLICLGYPFHPPGKPEKLRTDHLKTLTTPTLILQGSRDPFGRMEEVPNYDLSKHIRVHWLEDGDHSLKPRVKSGRTEAQNLAEAAAVAAAFIKA